MSRNRLTWFHTDGRLVPGCSACCRLWLSPSFHEAAASVSLSNGDQRSVAVIAMSTLETFHQKDHDEKNL